MGNDTMKDIIECNKIISSDKVDFVGGAINRIKFNEDRIVSDIDKSIFEVMHKFGQIKNIESDKNG